MVMARPIQHNICLIDRNFVVAIDGFGALDRLVFNVDGSVGVAVLHIPTLEDFFADIFEYLMPTSADCLGYTQVHINIVYLMLLSASTAHETVLAAFAY